MANGKINNKKAVNINTNAPKISKPETRMNEVHGAHGTKSCRERGTGDMLNRVLDNGMELLKDKGKRMYIDFLKIYAITLLFTIICLAIGAGVYFLTNDIYATAIVGIPLYLLLLLFSGTLETVTYNIIENSDKNKETEIFNHARENFVPWLKLSLFWLLITVIVISPVLIPLVLMYLNSGISTDPSKIVSLFAVMPLAILMIFLLFIILMVMKFLFQFSTFELYLGRKGLRESLKASYKMIKNNFIETIAFDLMVIITAMIVSYIFSMPMQIGSRLISFVMLLGGWAGIATGIIAILVMVLITILLNLLVQIGKQVLFYEFWKEIRGRVQ